MTECRRYALIVALLYSSVYVLALFRNRPANNELQHTPAKKASKNEKRT